MSWEFPFTNQARGCSSRIFTVLDWVKHVFYFFQVGDVSCHHGICSWMTKTQNWVATVVYHVYPGDRIRVDEAIQWWVVTKAFFLVEEIVPRKISWFITLSWFYFSVHNHTCTTSSNKWFFFQAFDISYSAFQCSSLFVLVRWAIGESGPEFPSHHGECYGPWGLRDASYHSKQCLDPQ